MIKKKRKEKSIREEQSPSVSTDPATSDRRLTVTSLLRFRDSIIEYPRDSGRFEDKPSCHLAPLCLDFPPPVREPGTRITTGTYTKTERENTSAQRHQ